MKRRFWTKQEDRTLRRRYPHEPTRETAAALGRTAAAISARAGKTTRRPANRA